MQALLARYAGNIDVDASPGNRAPNTGVQQDDRSLRYIQRQAMTHSETARVDGGPISIRRRRCRMDIFIRDVSV